ncbi:hypothetical protein TI05_00530 [Achromatium sp. WMS3]|nr:hypothetical protein TI05_00530 [Achromatium sp. WMS3]
MLSKVSTPCNDQITNCIKISILIFFCLSLVNIALLPLGLDEAYYWYWAKHPDLSYFDHPPLLAWIIWLGTNLGNDHEFFVRIGGFIFLWVGLGFSFATSRLLFPRAPKTFSWEYLFVLNLTIIVPGVSIIQTPDTPLLACWMLALYFGASVVMHQQKYAWYGLGLAIGLGLLSKYTMVLFVPSLLLFLILSPKHRFWFGRKEPWIGAMLALIVWLPVLIWNIQHDWVSFHFQLQHGLVASSNSNDWLEKLGLYIAGQAIIVSPLLGLSFVGSSLAASKEDMQNPVYIFLFCMTWPTIIFFAWSSLQGNQAEPNWPAPAYIAGILLSWALLRHHKLTTVKYKVIQFVIAVSLVINITLRSHLLIPWLPIPPKHDRLREFAGWPALGQQIKKIIDTYPQTKEWFILGDRGTTLAEALYYTQRHVKFPLLGFDPQRPERYLFLHNVPQRFTGKNAIIVARQPTLVTKRFAKFFTKLTMIAPRYQHRYRNVTIERFNISLYVGENFQPR